MHLRNCPGAAYSTARRPATAQRANLRDATRRACIFALRSCIVVGLGLAASASAPAANLLTGGGFETPALAPGGYQTIIPGSEPAGFGWKVAAGSVDLARLPLFPFVQFAAAEAAQALDLNGNDRGTIFQNFATLPGQVYALSLMYADNPFEGGLSSASLSVTDVAAGSSLLAATISHSTSTNGPPPQADWRTIEGAPFTAVGALSRLTIASTSASNTASGGIFLDALSIEPIPATADFDSDGDVDGRDLLAWQRNLGRTTDATLQQGDANGDRAVTAVDLAIWRQQFLSASAPTTTTVPEPHTMLIAAASFLQLARKWAMRSHPSEGK